MPLLTVRHTTTYRYRQPVAFGEHRLMLRPRDSYDQRLLETWLVIEPPPAGLRWVHDVFGNCVALARFAVHSATLRFESTIRLDHSPTNALSFELAEHARTYPFSYGEDERPDLLHLIARQYPDPGGAVERWARAFLGGGSAPIGTRDLLAAMTFAINQRFAYVVRDAPGIQEPAETLRLGSGSCRDFALLMMEAARALGLAARFVSGYLYVPDKDVPGRVGGGATHAWGEIYLPGAGWVEFDPTNGIVGNRDLIRVAVVRDPQQAVPLSGSWTGLPSDLLGMTVEVSVSADDDGTTG